MKTGKITAKLRDAVPVCLMVENAEVMRYKNIELPDALKEIEMIDFHFNVPLDGSKITFEIHYENGVLPEVFPEPRTRMTRSAKGTANEEAPASPAEAPVIPETEESAEAPEAEDIALETTPETIEVEQEETPTESETTEEVETAEEIGDMEISYQVTGIRRKELVSAISGITGAEAEYKAAPSFAYEIGSYIVDKSGTLTGPTNPTLTEELAKEGFTAAE